MTYRLDARDPDFDAAFAAFLSAPRGAPADVDASARAIVEDVAARGLSAVLDYARRFDDPALTEQSLAVSVEERAAARAACAPDDLAALELAHARIVAAHERQRPQDGGFEDAQGVALSWRWTPVDAVGVYVPGGRASYPSSALMNVVPAKVAGVARIAMTTPRGEGGINPLTIAAADIAGVDEIYAVGGAHAVAALAYGAGPIAPVDKIVGPGNAYVAAAKRMVFGRVGIDTIAGPSEVLVIADADNDPSWIAADLLSQAEHDPDAQAVLIADDAAFADAVAQAVEAQLAGLASRPVAEASWREHGAIIVVESVARDAPALADALAAEHVEIATVSPERIAERIKHAGAIFLGRHAPEVLGDYVTGSNHVLPTSRAARFASGLSTIDFMKRTSIQRVDSAGFAAIGPAAARLARAEGLPAHALAVDLRLRRDDQ